MTVNKDIMAPVIVKIIRHNTCINGFLAIRFISVLNVTALLKRMVVVHTCVVRIVSIIGVGAVDIVRTISSTFLETMVASFVKRLTS